MAIPMRRAAQALERAACEGILHRASSGVLALTDADGFPYAVPLSFVYKNGALLFHCALSGHKISAIQHRPGACFCVVGQDAAAPEKFTTLYQSVTVFGTMRFVTDEGEKRAALTALCEKYAPALADAAALQIERSMGRACVLQLDIARMTGKQARELCKPEPRAPGREILRTERLILREMTREDFPALCEMLQDPEVMYAYGHAFSDAEARSWLEKQFARYATDGFGLWAAVEKASGRMIGQCGLTMQDCAGEPMLEVGYLFQKAYWHKGFATEAATACRDYAFYTLGAPAVCSIIRDTNAASQRVALRNGMTLQKRFIKRYFDTDMPHLLFSVRRPEV